jgi:hypothetical protein
VDDSVLFPSGRLHAERLRRGTRAGSRALSACEQCRVGVAMVVRRLSVPELGSRQAIC